jgi:hypothetical protein
VIWNETASGDRRDPVAAGPKRGRSHARSTELA